MIGACASRCCAFFAAHAAFAAAPVITELKPRGAEIGRPFTLTAIGRNIGEGARVIIHAAGHVHAGARRHTRRDDAGARTLASFPGGAQGRCRARSLSHPHRIAVGHLQRPALHAGDVSGSDRGGIAAQLARRIATTPSRPPNRCDPPRWSSTARCAVRSAMSTAFPAKPASGACSSWKRGAADPPSTRCCAFWMARASNSRAATTPRAPAWMRDRFHLSLRRQLLRRSHRRALQHADTEFLPAQNGRVPLRRRHLPAGRPARRATCT